VLRAGPGRDPHVPYAPHCVRRPVAPTACKQALSLWDARRPDPRAGTTSKSAKGGREHGSPQFAPTASLAVRPLTGSAPDRPPYPISICFGFIDDPGLGSTRARSRDSPIAGKRKASAA